MQLPIWAAVAIFKQEGTTWSEKIRGAFRPSAKWGPRDTIRFEEYQKYRANVDAEDAPYKNANIFIKFKRNVFG